MNSWFILAKITNAKNADFVSWLAACMSFEVNIFY